MMKSIRWKTHLKMWPCYFDPLVTLTTLKTWLLMVGTKVLAKFFGWAIYEQEQR